MAVLLWYLSIIPCQAAIASLSHQPEPKGVGGPNADGIGASTLAKEGGAPGQTGALQLVAHSRKSATTHKSAKAVSWRHATCVHASTETAPI